MPDKKIDATGFSHKSLMSLIKLNDKLNRSFIELDDWKDMLALIDQTFKYTEAQITIVKTDFLKRR